MSILEIIIDLTKVVHLLNDSKMKFSDKDPAYENGRESISVVK